MAKLRITFEVDNITLFDTLKSMGGDTNAIGARVIGVMMTGGENLADAMGMGMYGIRLVNDAPTAAEEVGQTRLSTLE